MSGALIAAFLWLIAANIAAVIPSNDNHWRRAYGLIAMGLPILVWVAVAEGWVAAALCLAAGSSVLRWPLRYLWRWMRRMIGSGPRGAG